MVQDAVGDLIGNVARNAIQGCRLGMWDVVGNLVGIGFEVVIGDVVNTETGAQEAEGNERTKFH